MARNGVKTGGRDFKKGVVTNPKGAPKLTPEVIAFRQMSRDDIAKVLTQIWRMPVEQLKLLAGDNNLPAGEAATINIFARMIEEGDADTWEKVLNRLIGKVPQQSIIDVDVSHTVEQAKQLREMPREDLIAIAYRLIEDKDAS